MMFWRRSLMPVETGFVQLLFGTALDELLPGMRLHVRRLGDTRRALSLGGGRIYLPRSFFEHADPHRPLRLSHPVVAGVFAHELLHQWQRLQGRPVTWEAFGLHLRATCLRRDLYRYQACADPYQMLQCFLDASVEQQGQIWQDHVQALVQGQPLACMCLIAEHVHQDQAGRTRLGQTSKD
ncbi:hypothetical protein F3J24_00305 [Comamonas sp. Tr-654]|uniref:hypothetical protein n=1 Tax=Comamonas sp. Tr-654 TaxID=2608341 RepID=UPI00141FC897|nr:hypothetical protein [Comamonas sp. Tr-654]NIF81954.1 hypothetical protein [Comamonas sp. Tr-654]